MRNSIVAVIVTRNRLEKLQRALYCILPQEVRSVIVVDNRSSDGTVQWLNSLHSDKLTIVTPNENLGGAGGFALGFARAVEIFDPEWLLCFDDDAYPTAELIARFQSMNFPENTGIVAAAVYSPVREIMEMNRPLRRAPISIFEILWYLSGGRSTYVLPDSAYADKQRVPIQASSFVGCFVNRKVIAAIGVPRRELFIYTDDIIYTFQAARAGFANIFSPELICYHDCPAANKNTIEPLWKVYFLLRNQIEMHRIFNGANYWLPAIVRFGYYLARSVYYTNRREYLKLICRAFYHGLIGNFDNNPSAIQK